MNDTPFRFLRRPWLQVEPASEHRTGATRLWRLVKWGAWPLTAAAIACPQASCDESATPAPAVREPPNIVLILADDFGVGDIQSHFPGARIPTPVLDRLTTESLRFTRAHSASAVCTPTRYGLLTGRYAWRTRLQEWVLACYEPPLIERDRLTLPGMLRQAGYHTACIGKWHLGWNWPGPERSSMQEERNVLRQVEWDYTRPIGDGPTTRGFDTFFGVDLPNFSPFTFIENDRVVTQPTARYRHDPSEGVLMPAGFDGMPMAPGWRFDRILPTLTARAVGYIEERSRRRGPFFLFFSMTSPHEPVVPSPAFAGRSGIAPIADFIMETDWSVGELLDALDRTGLAEETLVIFTADNGHGQYTGWDVLLQAGHLPSGPFRGHKGQIWEGGHRVPFLVRWPGRVPSGESTSQLVCLNDLFATAADMLGVDLPYHAAEDSFSFLPTLTRGEAAGRTSLATHSTHGEFAYTEGPWKLVYRMHDSRPEKSRGRPTVAELYHLEDDVGETHDLVASHPEVVARMTAALEVLVKRGTSRPGPAQANDRQVDFRVSPVRRWAAAHP